MGEDLHKKIEQYVDLWEKRCYGQGIPDEAPLGLESKVPSYQRIALCILKNDLNLTELGFKGFHSKYYSILKKIEIDARVDNTQLKLKL